MGKIIAPLLILASAIVSYGASEIRLDNTPVLGVATGDGGDGFVRLSIPHDKCYDGWVWVPDTKAVALVLTARSTGANLLIAVVDDETGVTHHSSHHTITDCRLKSASM